MKGEWCLFVIVTSFRDFLLCRMVGCCVMLRGRWCNIILLRRIKRIIWSNLYIPRTRPFRRIVYKIADIKCLFLYFADRASQYIYLNINQLDALNFIMSLFHASTCFEHMCSSSGGQNCIIQHLVSSHSVGGLPVHRLTDLCTGRPPIGVMMIPDAVLTSWWWAPSARNM